MKSSSLNQRQRFPVTVPYRDGRLGHLLPKYQFMAKTSQPPHGNHLYQWQRGEVLCQADTGGNEPPRQRAEPHGHRGSIPKNV